MKRVKDLPQLKQEFIGTLARKSIKTVESYTKGVECFTEYLTKEKGLETELVGIKHKDIKNYKRYLENYKYEEKGVEKLYSAATINSKLSAVKALFKFLTEDEYVDSDPAAGTEMAKKKARIPKTVTMEEVQEVLEAIKHSSDKHKERDIAIVGVMINCGLRSMEVRGLRMEDVDLKNRVMRVVSGKGDKDRNIMLNDMAIKVINDYLIVRPVDCDGDALFLSDKKRAISESGIKHIIRTAYERAGIEGASAHSLRHTAGTEWYKATKDIRKVQKLLGHSDISTTQIYIDVHDKEMEEMMNLNIFAQ